MKRVYIITGAAGHLAGTIIQYLRKTECEIRGLILPSENGENDSQITYYKGDITKPESLEEIFSGLSGAEVIVIHAAGMISIADTILRSCIRSMYRVQRTLSNAAYAIR